MPADSICFLPISELSQRLAERQVSCAELLEAFLARIAALEGRLNAFITVMRAEAREAAQVADRSVAAGDYRGPLHGIPVALKDLFLTAGVRTTAGSKVLADYVPDHDATVVERLKKAGAIVIGKTNLHEFASGPTNINPHYGTAHNPWALDRVTGGSSGGSGAAVVASEASAALGSDTGGSVRIPAALCGIVGLKPTYGRISRFGVLPLSWSLDHAGPMTKTVEDTAILLQALAGFDRRDPASSREPVPNYRAVLTGKVRGLRAGIPDSHFFDDVEKDVGQAIDQAIHTLEGLGMTFQKVSLPNIQCASVTTMTISWSESAACHEPYLHHLSEYGVDVRSRVELGRLIPAVDYLRAQRARRLLRQEMEAVLREVDVLVTPTVRMAAPRIEECTDKLGTGKGADVRLILSALTRPFNLSGIPALSVPCGFTTDGLPIGLQVAGRAFDEATVLRVGHAYQLATDWHQRQPPL